MPLAFILRVCFSSYLRLYFPSAFSLFSSVYRKVLSRLFLCIFSQQSSLLSIMFFSLSSLFSCPSSCPSSSLAVSSPATATDMREGVQAWEGVSSLWLWWFGWCLLLLLLPTSRPAYRHDFSVLPSSLSYLLSYLSFCNTWLPFCLTCLPSA